jgi:Fe-S cluster assembly ATP-binding protein
MLTVKNLECVIDEKTILSDVSLDFNDGEFIAITGENGSGKSTLAKMIMGLMQPTAGQISLDKKDITKLSISERAQLGITYAFQTPVRFKGVTVASLLQVAATSEDVLDGKFDTKNNKYLEMVGLNPEEYLHREVNASLSGGEIKRIEIASVLARAGSARVLIFDEPEAGIDMWSLDNLLDTLKSLKNNRRDSTIIVISHNPKILEMADRVIILSHGKVKEA